MTLSCCRRAYSPRVKSSRRAGVAGGVGEGEVVAAGGVRGGDAAFLSNNVDLKKSTCQAITAMLRLTGLRILSHEYAAE